MTALEQYRPAEVATIPQAAAGLVEWAHAAQAAHTLAQSLVQTSFVPQTFRGKPGEATAAILAGAEVGLSPMAALSAFDVIQGRATPKAMTLRAIAQAHGCEIVVDESTSQRCVMRGRRPGEGEWTTVTWTLDRARQLQLLSKDQWSKQPTAMLVARATSELCRLIAADAVLGIGYTTEEALDEAPEPTQKVARTTATRVQRAKPAEAPREVSEPSFDEPPPVSSQEEVAPDEPPITEAQSKKLHAALRDAGISDRDAALAYISQEIGRDITSTKELTRHEASVAIDSLGAQPTIPEPES